MPPGSGAAEKGTGADHAGKPNHPAGPRAGQGRCRLRGIDRSAEVDELAALDARRGELLSAARSCASSRTCCGCASRSWNGPGKAASPCRSSCACWRAKPPVLKRNWKSWRSAAAPSCCCSPISPAGGLRSRSAAGVCLRRFPIRPKVRGPSGKDWVFSPHRPVRPQEMRRKPARKIRVFLPSRTACPLCSE